MAFIREALDVAGVSHLVERWGLGIGLVGESPPIWDKVLSLGEAQRVCLARALYRLKRLSLEASM